MKFLSVPILTFFALLAACTNSSSNSARKSSDCLIALEESAFLQSKLSSSDFEESGALGAGPYSKKMYSDYGFDFSLDYTLCRFRKKETDNATLLYDVVLFRGISKDKAEIKMIKISLWDDKGITFVDEISYD